MSKKLVIGIFTIFCSLLFLQNNVVQCRRMINKFENEKQYLRSPREIRTNTRSIDQAIGCKAPPSAPMYRFLNRICEDCFNVYRDSDLYHMCR